MEKEEEEEGDELSRTGSVPLGGNKWTFYPVKDEKATEQVSFSKRDVKEELENGD